MITKFKFYFILFFLFLLIYIPLLSADGNYHGNFLKIPRSARAIGMGEAFISVVDDVNSILYNPASLINLNNNQLSIFYTKYFGAINIFNLKYGIKSNNIIGFGFSVSYFYTEIDKTDITGNIIGDSSIRNFIINPAFGLKLNDFISLGIGLKYFQEEYIIENFDALYFNLSLRIFTPIKNLKVGIVVQNFDIYEKINFNNGQSKEIGVSYTPIENLTVAVDILSEPDIKNITTLFGAEYFLLDLLYIRAGYKIKYLFSGFSVGAGIEYENYQINYSFYELGTYTTCNNFSFSIKF